MRRAERHADDPRLERRQAGGRAQKRHEQDVRVRQARGRIARHAEERPCRPTSANAVGLPGLIGDAVKDHLAARGDDDRRSDRARRPSCRRRRRSGPRRRSASSAAVSASSVVLDRLVPLGHAAVRGDDGAEREAVDVVDLAGRQRRVRARRPRCRSTESPPAAARTPRRRRGRSAASDPTRLGVEQVAAHATTRSPAVMSAPRRSDVLARRRRREDLDGVAGPWLRQRGRVLDHHHGVGALGQRRAGRDFGAAAAARSSRAASGRCRSARRCASRTGASRVAPVVSAAIDGVSVHRRSRERRHVDARRHVGGGDAAGGIGQRHALGARDRADRRRRDGGGLPRARWSM